MSSQTSSEITITQRIARFSSYLKVLLWSCVFAFIYVQLILSSFSFMLTFGVYEDVDFPRWLLLLGLLMFCGLGGFYGWIEGRRIRLLAEIAEKIEKIEINTRDALNHR